MPRKKKIKEQTIENQTAPSEPVQETTQNVAVEMTEDELVTIRIKTGTLSFEDGTFQKDNIIKVSKERLKQFDPHDVEVVA
jgi:hypothetical protein